MNGDWPMENHTKYKVETLQSLSNSSFWGTRFREPQCHEKFNPDSRESDTTNLFHTSTQLHDDLAEDEPARPETDGVFEFGRNLMLNCSTVTIESYKNCSICLPFTSMCGDTVLRLVNSISNNVPHPKSPTWLARVGLYHSPS